MTADEQPPESLFPPMQRSEESFTSSSECPIRELGGRTFHVEAFEDRFPRQREWIPGDLETIERMMHPIKTISIRLCSSDDQLGSGERRNILIAAFIAAFRAAFPRPLNTKRRREKEGLVPVLVWRMPPLMTIEAPNPNGPIAIVNDRIEPARPIARQIRARAAVKWEKE